MFERRLPALQQSVDGGPFRAAAIIHPVNIDPPPARGKQITYIVQQLLYNDIIRHHLRRSQAIRESGSSRRLAEEILYSYSLNLQAISPLFFSQVSLRQFEKGCSHKMCISTTREQENGKLNAAEIMTPVPRRGKVHLNINVQVYVLYLVCVYIV